MTNDQLELLSDMIVDKLYAQLRPLLRNDNYPVAFEEMSPGLTSLHKDIDAFGNAKFIEKDTLARQLTELMITKERLMEEENYELLQELQEIYEKIKADYDKL